MRRALTLLLSCSLVCLVGCGQRYSVRMEKTLEKMRYAKRLDDNLSPPPADGKIKELAIYVRAPKGMERAKQFQLTALPPGQFDAEETYFEGSKSFLHVLARKKQEKKAAPKKDAPPVETAARGVFLDDVRNILTGYFADADPAAVAVQKDSSHKSNLFKRSVFKGNGKNVEVYTINKDGYDVALIFVIDPAEQAALVTKVALTLESFAVGAKAKALYSGAGSEEEAIESAGGVAF